MRTLSLICYAAVLSVSTVISAQDISGNVFFNYTHSGEKDAVNGFGFRRVYITINKKVSDSISYKLQTDVDYNNSPQYHLYIKIAKVDWKTNFGKVVVGLQGMNMFKVQENTWGHRYVEKSAMDQFKYSASADLGIGMYRSINKFGFSTLITNGSGYKKSETDSHKKISFRTVYGEQKLNKNDGFNVGGVYSTEPYDVDSVTVKSKTVIGFFGGYSGKGFRSGVEWSRKNDAGIDVTSQLTSLYGNYRVKPNVAVFMRYDKVSPNTQESSEDKNYMIAGLEFSPGKGLIIAPNYRTAGSENVIVLNFEFKF